MKSHCFFPTYMEEKGARIENMKKILRKENDENTIPRNLLQGPHGDTQTLIQHHHYIKLISTPDAL